METDDPRQSSPEGWSQDFVEQNGKKVPIRHFDRIIDKAREIQNKVESIPTLLNLRKDVLLGLELIRDYRSGEYRDIAPWAIGDALLTCCTYSIHWNWSPM